MHINSNTNMKKFMNRARSFYQFWMYGEWKMIEARPKMSQQAFGMDYKLWKEFYLCFQFWEFLEKMQSVLEVWGAASFFFWLGLWCICICQWIRFTKQVQKPLHWWFGSLIFHVIFFNLFVVKPLPIMRNLAFLVMHEILRLWWVEMLHKKIWKVAFSIFHI